MCPKRLSGVFDDWHFVPSTRFADRCEVGALTIEINDEHGDPSTRHPEVDALETVMLKLHEAKAVLGTSFAKKPLYAREGANVLLVRDGAVLERPTTDDDPGQLAAWTAFHAQVEQLPAEEKEVFGVLWKRAAARAAARAVCRPRP